MWSIPGGSDVCNCGIGYGGNKEETVSTTCSWYVHIQIH